MKIIYHGNCNDGFCAAWVAWKHYPDADFIPMSYGQPAPDVTGHAVYILDFSFPRRTLLEMENASEGLQVLDHHKTAQADLEGLAFCEFDMERSGATMAWDYFNHGQPRPWIVEAVEDRDLWRWQVENSKEMNAAITTWPRDFAWWENQLNWGETTHKAAITEGVAILRYIDQYTDEMCARARIVSFEGYEVPCVNVPYKGISEICGKLAETAPFSLGWAQEKNGNFVYSLRSRGDFDVSAIAKKYGGGGHKNSAGFTSDRLLV